MASNPEIMEKLVMQPVSSSYPTLGSSYSHKGHQIEYAPRLVRTGKNYYKSRGGIPKGERMSTAAEELAIQLGMEKAGIDPRTAEVFYDLFARNESHVYIWRNELPVYIWQLTETGLRVPKGCDPHKYETNGQGDKYWVRELLIGNNAIGEILVPEGNGRVVVEWDELSGLPSVTKDCDIHLPHAPYTTHSWFNENPSKDSRSKHRDVAVVWLRGGGEGWLEVNADSARSTAKWDGAFRPVRGSLPEIEKEIITI
ncbi:MAG: hypothetical protein HY051_03940 [Candidatus Aenigmarchaeota archaeon]|nr:hypothetical protein [Candidatus Aenigmarchaeota archaeon]